MESFSLLCSTAPNCAQNHFEISIKNTSLGIFLQNSLLLQNQCNLHYLLASHSYQEKDRQDLVQFLHGVFLVLKIYVQTSAHCLRKGNLHCQLADSSEFLFCEFINNHVEQNSSPIHQRWIRLETDLNSKTCRYFLLLTDLKMCILNDLLMNDWNRRF